jgi:hypothetical protein
MLKRIPNSFPEDCRSVSAAGCKDFSGWIKRQAEDIIPMPWVGQASREEMCDRVAGPVTVPARISIDRDVAASA